MIMTHFFCFEKRYQIGLRCRSCTAPAIINIGKWYLKTPFKKSSWTFYLAIPKLHQLLSKKCYGRAAHNGTHLYFLQAWIIVFLIKFSGSVYKPVNIFFRYNRQGRRYNLDGSFYKMS